MDLHERLTSRGLIRRHFARLSIDGRERVAIGGLLSDDGALAVIHHAWMVDVQRTGQRMRDAAAFVAWLIANWQTVLQIVLLLITLFGHKSDDAKDRLAEVATHEMAPYVEGSGS